MLASGQFRANKSLFWVYLGDSRPETIKEIKRKEVDNNHDFIFVKDPNMTTKKRIMIAQMLRIPIMSKVAI